MAIVPASVSKFNSKFTKVVPVIASFDPAGNIKPLYVRISGQSLKVLSVWSQEYGPLTIFHCTVNSNGMKREVALTYHSNETCWTYSVQ